MSRYGRFLHRAVGSPHGGRFASLEGYRAFAALIVVVYHTRGNMSPLSAGPRADVIDNLGNFGVAVFFLLSGFLLYLPVTRALLNGGRQASPVQFLIRRFVRIFPAYWLALVAWAALIDRANKQMVTPWKVFLLFDGGLNTLGVAWTLVIELWFYFLIAGLSVLLPRLLRRCTTVSSRLRAQLWLLAGMSVVAHAYRVWATKDPETMLHHVNWIFAFFDWFALGMFLALMVAWVEQGGAVPKALQGLADREWASFGLAAFTYATVMMAIGDHPTLGVPEPRMAFLAHQALQPVAAFFLLLPGTLGNREQPLQRWLRRPTVAALGTVSYGIYLWHTLVIRALKDHAAVSGGSLRLVEYVVVVVAVAAMIATLSYRLIERPALTHVPTALHRLAHPEMNSRAQAST